VDSVREVAQVPESALQMVLGGSEQARRALRVVGQSAQASTEGHERADQRLLCAVVKVALDPSPFVVGGAHDPRARCGDLAGDGRLGLGAARHLLEAAAVADVENDAVEPLALVSLDAAAALEHPPHIARGGEDSVLELELTSGLDWPPRRRARHGRDPRDG
jgi:hypothetical protein